jgi:hypothetical protein
MVEKLPKYRRGIGTGRTIAPKPSVPTGVAMLPHHNMGNLSRRHLLLLAELVLRLESDFATHLCPLKRKTRLAQVPAYYLNPPFPFHTPTKRVAKTLDQICC